MAGCLHSVYPLCRMPLHKCKVMFGGWLTAYKQWKKVPLSPAHSRTGRLQQEGERMCVYVYASPPPSFKTTVTPLGTQPPKAPLSAAKQHKTTGENQQKSVTRSQEFKRLPANMFQN